MLKAVTVLTSFNRHNHHSKAHRGSPRQPLDPEPCHRDSRSSASERYVWLSAIATGMRGSQRVDQQDLRRQPRPATASPASRHAGPRAQAGRACSSLHLRAQVFTAASLAGQGRGFPATLGHVACPVPNPRERAGASAPPRRHGRAQQGTPPPAVGHGCSLTSPAGPLGRGDPMRSIWRGPGLFGKLAAPFHNPTSSAAGLRCRRRLEHLSVAEANI